MGQFQPLEAIRNVFVKAPKPPDELEPLQYLRELHEMFSKRESNEDVDPKVLLRRFQVVRAVSILLKPLLRFERLLPVQARIGLEIATSQAMTPDVMVAMAPGMATFRKYVANALACAEENERPLVWLAWCLCSDLILAFDAQPFCTEAMSVLPMPLGPKPIERLIDVAEDAGVPSEYCSATKIALGSCLSGQMPEPACVVASSHPCDSMLSSYQSIQYVSEVPTFMLDTPNWDDERALDYYTGEFQKLIVFLEEHLDRKLDYDRLREVVTESNRTNELLMEIIEMQRARPCPGSGMPSLMAWFFRVLGMGTPEVTESTRRLHQVTRERMEAGVGAIKNEKIRVIWYDVPIVFYPLVMWMEETFGAVVVVDLLNFINTEPIDTSTPESMVRGLAAENKNLTMVRQFHGQIELLTRDLSRVCEDYGGDCFIYAGHAGCKHGWALTRHLKEYTKKIGMPLLILTSDIFDGRITSLGQLKRQIEEFFVSNGLA